VFFSSYSNILAEESSTYGTKRADADVGANMEAHNEELKDKVDGAVPTGVKKADATTGGRVFVGETGDLHDLAASRQP
jgi:hypothetical protein